MKLKYDFRNGRRYLFVTPESSEENEFLSNFFNSLDVISEKLTLKAQGKFSELTLSKRL